MLKRFSQEKYAEGKKQEYLDRKQESGEDTNEYYTNNKRYTHTHTLQARGAWYDFKDEMLVGLYDAGFSKHACSLCLRS